MKLGTLKTDRRDGMLVVVSRDLTRQRAVPHIAPTLQAAIDDWTRLAPCLAEVSADLNAGGPGDTFDPRLMAAPLPRAFQWADGSAYLNYLELVSRAVGAERTATIWADPLIYQGGSDTLMGARDDILAESTDWGIDFEAEIAVITDDVPMGASAEAAKRHLVLFMLANDVSLRGLAPAEQAKGFGYYHCKPPTAFSPVAVTADEFGRAWDGQKLHLPILSFVNGAAFGCPDTGTDMQFDLPTIIAHAAKTRPIGAGSIFGSGTVSNRLAGSGSTRIADGGVGHSSIAELRMVETIAQGTPHTAYLRFGDVVRIDMLDRAGASIFGAIEQKVARYLPQS